MKGLIDPTIQALSQNLNLRLQQSERDFGQHRERRYPRLQSEGSEF